LVGLASALAGILVNAGGRRCLVAVGGGAIGLGRVAGRRCLVAVSGGAIRLGRVAGQRRRCPDVEPARCGGQLAPLRRCHCTGRVVMVGAPIAAAARVPCVLLSASLRVRRGRPGVRLLALQPGLRLRRRRSRRLIAVTPVGTGGGCTARSWRRDGRCRQCDRHSRGCRRCSMCSIPNIVPSGDWI